ncbi:DUF6065 family protein [Caulobacter mirabilis]|uniref:Uncharacterized protein n=1 Tax=Caulobacter mirabilis TaxID=69666 RepID=A0A2D2B0U0_9CAUL|nr:DUF6065 family protein [Caulobacter mirabilis]ATQ43860.1 hypothetical protein CSW64_16380 [Caulobacter mirabilis]
MNDAETPADGLTELTAFVLDGYALDIRPAPLERPWMDASPQRFAYRCLPLNIANAHGWEILCPTAFEAIWDGRVEREGVEVRVPEGVAPPAVGHFGSGVLTFHLPCLFRTDPGVDLFVTGPLNRPKDGIGPLSGVVETDWSPYTFTMNWLFTRADHRVRFEKGEPFCHVFPVRRGQLDGLAPRLRPLASEPDLMREHTEWSDSRLTFNTDLEQPDSPAAKEGWQKAYFRGATPSGAAAPRDHRSKLRLKPFAIED